MKTRIALLVVLLGAAACSGLRGGSGAATPDVQALWARTLDSLWTTVNEEYVYADFDGTDWDSVRDEYQGRLDQEIDREAFSAILGEMLAELPPGTAYLQTREERIAAAAQEQAGYEGIGTFISLRGEPQPRIILLSVMPDSPAEQAGLKSHDAILAIDGQPVTGADRLADISRVRGPAGSNVTLTVRSPGEAPRDVAVTRDHIDASQARLTWRLVDEGGIAYMLFPPAEYELLLQDFELALKALSSGGDLNGLIVDLRIVSAGQNWPTASLLAVFADGEVGEFYSRSGSNPATVEGRFDFVDSQEIPLALLVGPSTTGAAEVFAASLQATEKAIVVGAATPGDVEIVSPYFMPDGSLIFLATSSFRTGKGLELGLEGVRPDVLVPADWDEVSADQDDVLNAALEVLRPDA